MTGQLISMREAASALTLLCGTPEAVKLELQKLEQRYSLTPAVMPLLLKALDRPEDEIRSAVAETLEAISYRDTSLLKDYLSEFFDHIRRETNAHVRHMLFLVVDDVCGREGGAMLANELDTLIACSVEGPQAEAALRLLRSFNRHLSKLKP